eukprot:1975895-Rhodomonas_salina.2
MFGVTLGETVPVNVGETQSSTADLSQEVCTLRHSRLQQLTDPTEHCESETAPPSNRPPRPQ